MFSATLRLTKSLLLSISFTWSCNWANSQSRAAFLSDGDSGLSFCPTLLPCSHAVLCLKMWLARCMAPAGTLALGFIIFSSFSAYGPNHVVALLSQPYVRREVHEILNCWIPSISPYHQCSCGTLMSQLLSSEQSELCWLGIMGLG